MASTLTALKESMRAFAAEVATENSWQRPEVVAASLQRHNLTADRVILKHSVKVEIPKLISIAAMGGIFTHDRGGDLW